MSDTDEPRRHLDIYKLASSIADAYFGSLRGPAVLPAERAALRDALVARVAELLAMGHTFSEVGNRVRNTVEEWEHKHQLPPGPHRFMVTNPDEVIAATSSDGLA